MPPDPTSSSSPPPPRHASQNAWDHNARAGLVLFVIYLALYGGFIFLNAFAREVMAKPSLGGVNLASVYGFGLIFAAFLLALVYMVLCKREPETGPELTEAQLAAKAAEEEGQA